MGEIFIGIVGTTFLGLLCYSLRKAIKDRKKEMNNMEEACEELIEEALVNTEWEDSHF